MVAASLCFRFPHANPLINELLKSVPPHEPCPFNRCFNQTEEFFLQLEKPYTVPSFPIHHDVKRLDPDPSYIEKLRETLRPLCLLVPTLFQGLTYRFDPAEILRPFFYSLYAADKERFLFILRLDLTPRLREVEVLQKGTNDATPAYRSRNLYLEADLVPLDLVETDASGTPAFWVRHLISQTWVGEEGRGYFVQGIWIDRDLSKFFTKLFLPPGARLYPYYPFNSRYRTLCLSLAFPEQSQRVAHVSLLRDAIRFITPYLPQIEQTLKNTPFSENLNLFQELKAKVPSTFFRHWQSLRARPYLNAMDMKEYVLEEQG